MPRPPILSPEHQQYVIERYIGGDVPPRELLSELDVKFGIVVKPSALRQWITRSGLAKRKAEVDRKTRSIVSGAKVTALAKAKAAEPAAHIARWAERTVDATDKAFDMVDTATKPRDLASAISAASTSIRMFRVMAGIDGVGSGPITPANFNFNFGNCIPTRMSDGLPYNAPVSVQVTCAPGTSAPSQPVTVVPGTRATGSAESEE